jgi:hypothetical protein
MRKKTREGTPCPACQEKESRRVRVSALKASKNRFERKQTLPPQSRLQRMSRRKRICTEWGTRWPPRGTCLDVVVVGQDAVAAVSLDAPGRALKPVAVERDRLERLPAVVFKADGVRLLLAAARQVQNAPRVVTELRGLGQAVCKEQQKSLLSGRSFEMFLGPWNAT